ncbi:plasmid replication/partition related protein [Paracidovorax wautersii]|uniref:Plasmid replication/partition related protein n=1 Tax=Paracidovorax wautersii TaxID=1177982 RepID=A0A1I2BY32_9BURK|nr:plasmid replication/partition related protein [Paracidovorax wautersii]SFE61049.1 hypothetical protein SAMN04489711_103268 [Paracidovorax wautersii]
MNIVVNEELKAYIDPLTPQEHEALERSILAEGCRDALVLWGDLLIDGHNRYGICTKHGLPFNTVQATRFQTMEDVHLWMIDQHLGRRSVSDFQRGVLALRKKEIVQARQARAAAAAPAEGDAPAAEAAPAAAPAAAGGEESLASREAIARAARISSNQVVMIEKIRSQAAPEVVEAVKSGVISINAAAAVATLPQEEQVAAATAGKDELRQAAKRVREAKRKPAATAAADESAAAPEGGASAAAPADELQALRERVAALTAENAALRARLQALGDHDASAPF